MLTVSLPTCKSYVKAASITPNATIMASEDRKNKKYEDNCKIDNFKFTPLAFESFGAWSSNFKDLFNSFIDRMEDKGKSRNCQISYWTKRISCTIMKFNSRCIIRKLNSIGYKKSFGDEAFREDIVGAHECSVR